MEYKNTKRSGVLFILLNIITLTVFSWFSIPRIRKEINSFVDEDHRSGFYFPKWVLGILTIGVAPIAYEAAMARKVDAKARELGLASSVSFASFFNLCFFGALFIVGPWIAWSKFFRTLNRVETKLNDLAPAKAEPVSPAAEEKEEEDEEDSKVGPNEIKIRFSGGKKVSDKTKWRVVDRQTGEILTFATQAEAISHAVSLAKRRGVGVKVNGRVDKRAK